MIVGMSRVDLSSLESGSELVSDPMFGCIEVISERFPLNRLPHGFLLGTSGLEKVFGNFLDLNEKMGSYLWVAKETKRIGLWGFDGFGALGVRICLAPGKWLAEAKTSCFCHSCSVGPGALLGTERLCRNSFDNSTIL
jgi:hypothetical protein